MVVFVGSWVMVGEGCECVGSVRGCQVVLDGFTNLRIFEG